MGATIVQGRAFTVDGDGAVLDRIMDEGVELAVWQRQRGARLEWIDPLDWDGIDDLDFPVAIDVLDRDLADGLAEAGYPDGERSDGLRLYVAEVVRHFAAIVGCDAVRLRLEVIEGDACRRFHSDAVTARALVTLSGSGTQWIEVEEPGAINELTVGDVAIFKGRNWVEEPRILHRSPPIAGTGDTRLLLAIDPFMHERNELHDQLRP